MNIEKESISKNIDIYRTQYNWEYSKESLIERVDQNIIVIGYTDYNTSSFVIKSKEIDSVIRYGMEACKKLSGLVEGENWNGAWVGKTWIFKTMPNTIPPPTYDTGYHTHPIAVSYPTWDSVTNKYKEFSTLIKTSWTYCFYLQMPKVLKDNEGMLGFKDGNDVIEILPKEGEFVIFGKDVMHRPNLIPNSNEDRIAICSNVSFNITNVIKKTKSIL
jgi:hypothetical protein